MRNLQSSGLLQPAMTSTKNPFVTVAEIEEVVKPGDILEFERAFHGCGMAVPLYSHMAIKLAEGQTIMNLNGKDNDTRKALFEVKTIREVAKGSRVRINNLTKEAQNLLEIDARPVEDIIKAAKDLEGQWVDYEVDGRNCEFYCTLVRYGDGFSTQATSPAASTGGKLIKNANIIPAAAALIFYYVFLVRNLYGRYGTGILSGVGVAIFLLSVFCVERLLFFTTIFKGRRVKSLARPAFKEQLCGTCVAALIIFFIGLTPEVARCPPVNRETGVVFAVLLGLGVSCIVPVMLSRSKNALVLFKGGLILILLECVRFVCSKIV